MKDTAKEETFVYKPIDSSNKSRKPTGSSEMIASMKSPQQKEMDFDVPEF